MPQQWVTRGVTQALWVENKVEPALPNLANLYELSEEELRRPGIGFLPTTLREVLDCLEKNEVVKKASGAQYAVYYLEVKFDEWRQYHQSVSQWETDRYLMAY